MAPPTGADNSPPSRTATLLLLSSFCAGIFATLAVIRLAHPPVETQHTDMYRAEGWPHGETAKQARAQGLAGHTSKQSAKSPRQQPQPLPLITKPHGSPAREASGRPAPIQSVVDIAGANCNTSWYNKVERASCETYQANVVAQKAPAAARAPTASTVIRLEGPRAEFPARGVKGAAADRYLILDLAPWEQGATCNEGDTRMWSIIDWERHGLPLAASLGLCQRSNTPPATAVAPPPALHHRSVVCHPTFRAPNDHVNALRFWSRYYLSRGFERVFVYTSEASLSADVLALPGLTWVYVPFLASKGEAGATGSFYYSQVRLSCALQPGAHTAILLEYACVSANACTACCVGAQYVSLPTLCAAAQLWCCYDCRRWQAS